MKLSRTLLVGLVASSVITNRPQAFTPGSSIKALTPRAQTAGRASHPSNPLRAAMPTLHTYTTLATGIETSNDQEKTQPLKDTPRFRDYTLDSKTLAQPKRQYARVKRLQHGIRQFNTTESINQAMKQPLTWLNREAYENLRAVRGKALIRKLQWITTFKAPPPYSVRINGKEKIDVTPAQAKQLTHLLEDMQPTRKSLGLQASGNRKERSTDLLSLIIKPNTDIKQIEEFMTQESGQLGWQLFKNLIKYSKGGDPLKRPDFLSHNGACLKMSTWREHYLKAVFKRVNFPALVDEIKQDTPLTNKEAIKSLNIAAKRELNNLLNNGVIGPELFKIPKFATELNNHVFNAIALERKKAGITAEKTISTRKTEKLLKRHFSLPNMPTAAARVSQGISDGLIEVRPLSKKAFKRQCIDSFGYDRSPRTLGLARGAQTFVKSNHWRGLSTKHRLNYEDIAVALHEGVHASDYLEDPVGFRQDDPLVNYHKETRAFHAENGFLRGIGQQVSFIFPRFGHTRDIGQFVREHYARTNYTAPGGFKQFQQDISAKYEGKYS